jgi:hypothetical protein
MCRLPVVEEEKRLKLLGLICAIPYAEEQSRLQGKRYLVRIEEMLKKWGLHSLFCRSFGSWNFHVCHAQRFGYTTRAFKKILQHEEKAVDFVIELLLTDIGLHKLTEHILAEYNHNVMATTVVALQRALNQLMQKYHRGEVVKEDGLIGEQTAEVLELSNKILRPPLCFRNESDIDVALDRLDREEGIRVLPFIPQVQIKKDFSFIKEVLKKSMKNPAHLKKLPHVFQHHIDVPLYVQLGMDAYQFLQRKT